MTADQLRESPEDRDIVRWCILDRPVPWGAEELNKFLKKVTEEELIEFYFMAPEPFFRAVYERLGEPFRLKRYRLDWEAKRKGAFFEDEELKLWDPWRGWCEMKKEIAS